MKYQISYEKSPQQKDIETLSQGISQHAKKIKNLDPVVPFAFFIRDENNLIKGGCNGNIGYNWLYVDQLWVEDNIRNQGYGTQLMNAAEKLAKDKNCHSLAVNTAEWEALDFYKKLGFRVELERKWIANQSKFYFLRKDFHNKNIIDSISYHDENFFMIESDDEENEYIGNALTHYNSKQVPFTQAPTFNPLCFHMRDKNDEIIAGIKAVLYCWGCLFIDLLWISEHHRGKKLGSFLLKQTEIKAKALGCHLVHLDTYDFQAKGFYLKNGYEIFGELDDCPPGHKRFFLKKFL